MPTNKNKKYEGSSVFLSSFIFKKTGGLHHFLSLQPPPPFKKKMIAMQSFKPFLGLALQDKI
ncbi:hypothetical protein ACFC3A_12950 [Enterococcus thailandicus]|uniref:hypothetical protein n=1 Tax=Enterococcus thailandicus TaxID=417368 RepID=UPI0039A62FE0